MSHFDETLGGGVGGRKVLQKDSPAVFLDPWLTAGGDALKALVEDLMPLLKPTPGRIRSLRRDAEVRQRQIVANVVANLVSFALSPVRVTDQVLAIPTAKTKPTRYEREDYPKSLLKGLLEVMAEAGLILLHPYVFQQRSTTVEPTALFRIMLERHCVRLRDIGRDRGGETIWLSARTGEAAFGDQPQRKCLIHYQETEETRRLRREIDDLSEFLNGAGISFDGELVGPTALRRMFLLRRANDPERFELNGRLAGGFWMNLKASERHRITVGSEPIVDLDYVSMFAMLAYLKVSGKLPNGDPYNISGLEDHRAAAKLGLLSLLSRSNAMKRLSPELMALLPESWTAKALVNAMVLRHPAIAPLFGSDVGIGLMHIEATILLTVLSKLKDQGIAALGMHDGCCVAASAKGAALKAMREASREILGVELPVKEKSISRPQGRWLEAA